MTTTGSESPWAAVIADASIDAAAGDGRATLRARAAAATVTSVVLAVIIDVLVAAVWLTAYAATEAWAWHASRAPAAGAKGSQASRLSYLGAVAGLTLTWTMVGALFWLSRDPGLRIAAVTVIAAQLIHAQAFSFRSVPVLLVSAGIPAAALLLLPLGFGGYQLATQVTMTLAWLMSVTYVGLSARANIVTAAGLRAVQAELEELAYRDSLTLLGNRRLFADNLRRRIEFSSRHDTRFALLVIDLDRFKTINDTLGHAAGDTLLVEVGRRLRSLVAAGDDIARTGGDEFAILVDEAGGAVPVEAICQRICDSFAEAIECEGVAVRTSASVGFARYPEDGARLDSLMRSADLALYESKRCGRGTWRQSAQE